MTTIEEGLKKAELIQEALKGSEIPQEAKALAMMGSIMGASNESIIQNLVSQTDSIITKADKTPTLRKPKNYTKTQSVLHDMMTENTGIAMMDSGGDSGRAWQKNRGIADFREMPRIKAEIFGYYSKGEMPGISKSLFHFLDENLTYSAEMTAKFKRFCNKKENKEESYYGCIESFAESFQDGSYPESIIQDNSYNHETTLDQDIQYCIFSHEGLCYVILQIHGGADIRGGYTDPKVFEAPEGFDYFLGNQNDLRASCDCIQPYSDDSGYHWYDTNNPEELDEYKRKKYDFPKIWHWSQRLEGVYCQACRKKVNFE